MKHSTRSYPRVHVDTARSGAVAQAGGVLLTQTAEVTGLTAGLRAGLGRWRKPLATHDPGKILSDLALSLALGGDCLADLGLLRAEPGVYGHVASEATVSRTMTTLSHDTRAALRAIDLARAAARARAWELAGQHSPGHGACAAEPLVVDIDATLVISRSEKEKAAPTFKRTFGFHPLLAFLDHGPSGTGEPLAVRTGGGLGGLVAACRSRRAVIAMTSASKTPAVVASAIPARTAPVGRVRCSSSASDQRPGAAAVSQSGTGGLPSTPREPG